MYELTMAAANLKAAVPEQFAVFVEAVKLLEEKYKSDLIAAEAGGILNAQGRTAAIVEIRKRLETCFEKRKSYQNRV